jgi:hypothetical protein
LVVEKPLLNRFGKQLRKSLGKERRPIALSESMFFQRTINLTNNASFVVNPADQQGICKNQDRKNHKSGDRRKSGDSRL